MVAGQNGQSSTYAAPHVTTERRRGRARALTRSLSTTGVTARARTRRARPVSWSTVQSTVSGCRGPNGATARMCVAEGFRADLASFWLKCTEESHARETLRKCRLATNTTARFTVAGVCGHSGLTAPLPAARGPKTGPGNATTLLHSTAETTALESPPTLGSARDSRRAPWTASGTSGHPGPSAPSAVPTGRSIERELLNPPSTGGESARDRQRNPNSATPNAVQVRTF
jgi:hypothetical protein